MEKPFYITTAIDYTNAPPHIGHAYEKILGDVMARDRRARGREVVYLIGVDQHGQKVQQSAARAGVRPEVFAQDVTAKFLDLWKRLDIAYDRWAETTAPQHTECVRAILNQLHQKGKIYKARHGGYYSVRQEQFLTEKDRGADGSFSPDWGEVVFLKEENYYFRLTEFKDWLVGFLEAHRESVLPAFRWTELRNAVERLTGDLCISRPKSRLAWGIELPFDPEFVTYVWFDALINYISFAGYTSHPVDFERLWPADYQVIGKDILAPAHGIYWLIMLRALDFPDERMPRLLVHGYINLRGDKISKSAGNTVDPAELVGKYGAEALRYYLMREAVTGQDMEFSEDRLVARHNSDLANGLGNLLNRTLGMAKRYRQGVLKKPADSPLAAPAAEAVSRHRAAFDRCEPHAALEAAAAFVAHCNGFIEESAPWKLAKDPAQAERLDAVLYGLAESLRILATLHEATIPQAAQSLREQLNTSLTDTAWGGLPDGHVLGAPRPLFPRIETPA